MTVLHFPLLNWPLCFPFRIWVTLFTSMVFLNVIWKIMTGIIVGSLIGYFTAKIILKPAREMAVNDDFIAIALAFIAYGGTELVYGNGFIGVFVAAHVFRHYKHDHKFHNTLHNFSQQVEHLITPLSVLISLIGSKTTFYHN